MTSQLRRLNETFFVLYKHPINVNDEFIDPTFLLFLLLCAKWLEWEHNNSYYKS
jgi:hypothetical protein